MSDPVLGFVGIGRMGKHMTTRLLAAGHSLKVFDTNAAAVDEAVALGAEAAASAKEVADTAETVMISLPTPDIVHQVVLGTGGIVEGGRVKTVIDLSTSGPGMAIRAAKGLEAHGIAWVDAPVCGGVAGARDGKLAVMVSGPKAATDIAQPLLANFGKVFFVGEKAGLAQVCKLGNNLLAASAMVVTSEAMVMGVKAGIDPKVMLDIINASSGRNSATQDKFPRAVLPRTFDFGFATGLSYKDVRLCIDEAEAMGVPMVAGAAVREMLAVTNARFGADLGLHLDRARRRGMGRRRGQGLAAAPPSAASGQIVCDPNSQVTVTRHSQEATREQRSFRSRAGNSQERARRGIRREVVRRGRRFQPPHAGTGDRVLLGRGVGARGARPQDAQHVEPRDDQRAQPSA